MAWTTPRTWVAGEMVTAALMNGLRDELNALAQVGVFTGLEGAIYGASPPAGTAKVLQQHSQTATVSGGACTIGFSSPFLSGVSVVLATPGDNASSLGFLQVPLNLVTLSQFVVYPWQAGSNSQVVNGNSIRVNWLAVGW